MATAITTIVLALGCRGGKELDADRALLTELERLRASCSIEVDRGSLLGDVEELSSDRYAGRASGTPGGLMARDFVLRRFEEIGVVPFEGSFLDEFNFESKGGVPFLSRVEGVRGPTVGWNVVGRIDGDRGGDVIVVTAHYDHKGELDGEIYNGADDNASGVAALFEIAAHFQRCKPIHTIVLAALDAEEHLLRGAQHFVDEPPIPLESILINVNIDMISRSEKRELWASGTRYHKDLRPVVRTSEDLNEGFSLRFGHDHWTSSFMTDWTLFANWTLMSDQAKFHEAGIPFIFFSVEDGPSYHTPKDDFESLDFDFFESSVRTVIGAIEALDLHYALRERRAVRGRHRTSRGDSFH